MPVKPSRAQLIFNIAVIVLLIVILGAVLVPKAKAQGQNFNLSISAYIYNGPLAGIPATCSAGDLAFITNATNGQNIYECNPNNIFTQQLNSGGGGSPGGADTQLQFNNAGAFGGVTKWTTNGTTTITAAATGFLNLSAAAQFYVPVSAGCTTATNGQICHDTTSAQWKIWQNGADRFIVTSSVAGTTNGQIPIFDASLKTFVPGDPLVQGLTAHDAVGTSTNPVLIGGYASAAAPSDVSNDGDATRAWVLRNGSPVVNLAAGGALIPGDATNGLKVQVTTAPVTHVIADSGTITAVTGITSALPAGTNVIGHVISDTGSTTAVTGTVAENLTQVAGTALGATAVTNFGTAPAAAAVPGVNASLFAGTTGITATGTSANINCTNCGFTDNSAFTPGTSGVNVLGGYYTSGAAPAITSGNVGRLAMDANSALKVDVVAGGAGGGVAQTQVQDPSGTYTCVGYFTGCYNMPTQDASSIAPGAPSPNWVMGIGGSDYGTTPTMQPARVDSTGSVYVANPLEAAELNTLLIHDQVASSPSVSPPFSELVAGQFGNVISPLTKRQSLPLQVDAYGNTLVTVRNAVPVQANVADASGIRAVFDPCQSHTKIYGTQSVAANTQFLTGTANQKIYFCSWTDRNSAAAVQNYAIVEGTGSTCANGIAAFPGLSGGTTAVTGWSNVPSGGGSAFGNGEAAIAGEAVAGDNVCILVTNATQVNLGYSYVVVP